VGDLSGFHGASGPAGFRRRRHRIYLIQDNASYHKKQEAYDWFKANRRYVEVFQLPPYWQN
jgi:hypothetical protein